MSENRSVRIAVGMDSGAWHEKFADALAAKVEQGYPLEYMVVNLQRHDWLEKITLCDLVIWAPHDHLGAQATSHLKERVSFLQDHLGKIVVPNLKTVWHYDSKVAQSYAFAWAGIPTPQTFVSFDYQDAVDALADWELPVVVKKSWGASSENVRLVSKRQDLKRIIEWTFCQQVWDQYKREDIPAVWKWPKVLGQLWFWAKVWQKVSKGSRQDVVYWQQFIPGNSGDLRIAVIGDRYAMGFWRNNRPNDFRASGSGRIDYDRTVPEELVRYCLSLNKRFDFDSMAYDIIFRGNQFVITEMSYTYVDSLLHKAAGHYALGGNGELSYVPGHVWPEALWVEWALHRVECQEVG